MLMQGSHPIFVNFSPDIRLQICDRIIGHRKNKFVNWLKAISIILEQCRMPCANCFIRWLILFHFTLDMKFHLIYIFLFANLDVSDCQKKYVNFLIFSCSIHNLRIPLSLLILLIVVPTFFGRFIISIFINCVRKIEVTLNVLVVPSNSTFVCKGCCTTDAPKQKLNWTCNTAVNNHLLLADPYAV